MALLIVVMIILWVVYSIVNGQAKGNNKNSKGQQQGTGGQRNAKSAAKGHPEDANLETSERLKKKYEKRSEESILDRAKASVETEFSRDEVQRFDGEQERIPVQKARGKAKKSRTQEKNSKARKKGPSSEEFPAGGGRTQPGNASSEKAGKSCDNGRSGGLQNHDGEKERERLAGMKMQQEEEKESDLLKQVEDLMVMGPDVSLTFRRDFLAEGMDMLNKIQVM